VSTFSPDGRLYQVEYARESVKRGTTTVGLIYKAGVVLIVDKRIQSKLVITDSIEKMYQIDNHIGITTSGLVADARQLVDRARAQCQINRMTYGDAIPVSTLVKKMCDYKQSFTQYGGARPFGTALLIAGMDEEGVHLYETDPSGAYQSYHAGAIGRGRSSVIDYFEGKWKAGMTKNAAIKLGLVALRESLEDDLNPETVEIASVDKDGYSKMDTETTLKHLDKLS
jgi:proteasome alpha subunit